MESSPECRTRTNEVLTVIRMLDHVIRSSDLNSQLCFRLRLNAGSSRLHEKVRGWREVRPVTDLVSLEVKRLWAASDSLGLGSQGRGGQLGLLEMMV